MLVTLPAPQNKNVPKSRDMLLTLSSTPEIIRESNVSDAESTYYSQ